MMLFLHIMFALDNSLVCRRRQPFVHDSRQLGGRALQQIAELYSIVHTHPPCNGICLAAYVTGWAVEKVLHLKFVVACQIDNS